MDENELNLLAEQELKNPTPPPVQIQRQPVPQGMTMQDFFSGMTAYETMRQTILKSEFEKMQSIENIVAKRVETHLATLGDNNSEVDPVMQEAGKFLIDFVKQSATQQNIIKANPKPATAPTKPPIDTKAQPENVQPEPNKEVKPMRTEEELTNIANKIFEHYPKDVYAFQQGLLTKEDAIKKIKMGGLSQEEAEKIADIMLDTEYTIEEEK